MVLVGKMSAQQAAHAVHKRERKACQEPKTALGAFRKKGCEMQSDGTLLREIR